MGLNIEKLENVKYKGSRIIARCPACAEQGNDNKGEHLSIDEQGRFSCVINPGGAGADHRRRIFAMIGIKDGNNNSYSSQQNKVIKVKKVDRNTGNVIKSNILGRLGRVYQTLKKHNENDIKEHIYNKDFEKGVPSVPNDVDCKNDDKICARCGNQGKRFCFGEVASGRFNYDFFCLDCRPHHF